MTAAPVWRTMRTRALVAMPLRALAVGVATRR